ncbi:Uncharacterized protein dnm_005390 [Desulfonema magnum]|uniref:Uncharacterized protein n=1 Tax=Desulfonema magnum TaxID=45655 RepID=A0A975BFM4_9BACT|nr:Uncharacterized protein dnm_005390 [Desulfonema magnum]
MLGVKVLGVRWGDENVSKALKKLIPFLFPAFFNCLIFKS